MKRFLSNRTLLVAVLATGSLQLVGWATGWTALQRLGQLTAASPLPLVFSTHQGWESFSPRFVIDVKYRDGKMQHVPVEPRVYAELPGPYNRRNVYGAVMAFGPLLAEGKKRAMRDQVLHYAFCDGGPLARLASRPDDVVGAVVSAAPRARGESAVWVEEIKCGAPR